MSALRDELAECERAWMEAVQRKDIATLEQILGEEYVYTATGQGRRSRQRWLDTVPIYDIVGFDLLDLDVNAYADGTIATAFSHYRQEAIVGGQPRSGEFLITDVWVRRDGRWQVVARSSIMQPATS